jgi:L-alanine-DL-glutamate epimerase-like enolase superfamily enzyme
MVAPRHLAVFCTSIPMRSFEHAAASRTEAEGIIVRLELTDGRVGYGETHPRVYVTGETLESVMDDIAQVLWPRFCESPGDPLPLEWHGRCIQSAACAVDLAWADAQGQFSGPMDNGARVSGVLGSRDADRTAKRLRLMRWFGLRDFKLKLGLGEAEDQNNIQVVTERLGRAIRSGKCSLRVDVNGAWSLDETPERIAGLKSCGVCAVEQPVFVPAEPLLQLAMKCPLPLMADESLLTYEDGQALSRHPERIWFNLRLAKNGGIRPTLDLVHLASERRVPWTCGCMVGETSILSAAQRRLLQVSPKPKFVEGNYGRLLLAGDVARPSLRFAYGGRLRSLGGDGLGARVDTRLLARYADCVHVLDPPKVP